MACPHHALHRTVPPRRRLAAHRHQGTDDLLSDECGASLRSPADYLRAPHFRHPIRYSDEYRHHDRADVGRAGVRILCVNPLQRGSLHSPSSPLQVYFVAMLASTWALAFATAYSVLVVLVLNETTYAAESRYLAAVAFNELLMPVHMFLLSLVTLMPALALWLSISLLDLSTADKCDASPSECNWYPWTFLASMILTLIVSVVS